ncbi:MAG: XapX domain-containing protein [Rhizomicrobium sp.]
MIAAAIGLVLGLAIGAGCRLFGVPLPAPERLIGALVLLAMTLGFVAADRMFAKGETPAHLDGR